MTLYYSDRVEKAIVALAERCDGAVDDDGKGFNGRDTRFGKSLAQQIAQGRKLTDNQLTAAVKMLQTYRNQLAGIGCWIPTVLEFSGVKPATKIVEYDQDGQVLFTYSDAPTPTQRQYEPPAPKPATTVAITAHEGQYCVRFPYDPALVDKIKDLPRRKFVKELGNAWLVPVDCDGELVLALQGYQTEWKEDAYKLAEQAAKVRAAALLAELDLEIPNLHPVGELMPFQKAGVNFIDTAGGRAIIGDDMGLGKTIQAIGYLALHPELRPAVIVAPASLKPNWRREIEKWLAAANNTVVINGSKAIDGHTAEIIIINYDILSRWHESLALLQPAVLICDEAHYLKNPKSQRTKAAQALAKHCKKVVLMTGTPIMNRPVELFPLLQMVQPDNWSNFMAYARRYCGAKQRTMGRKKFWDFSGATNLTELNDKLKSVMIRRKKSQVLTELPEKRRVVVPMAIDRRAYDDFMEETLEALEEAGNRAAQLTLIEKAKQYVVGQKMEQIFEWVDNFLDSGEKLILFCIHRLTVDQLMARYGERAVRITGDSSQNERDYAVQSFQNDPATTLFVGNIQAAGVGLTLTAASNVAFIELAWRPGDQTQAEDRAHRYGQKNAVTAWYLLAEGTIEEDTFNLLEKKRLVTEAVTDGQVSEMGFATDTSVANDLIDLVMKRAKEGYQPTLLEAA